MNIDWDSDTYTSDFDFVYKYGDDVTSLITAPVGSTVVDLGCGNGALTAQLSETGYDVIGVDASEKMLAAAKKAYPSLKLVLGDASRIELSKKADVVFSNAVFHWIDNQDALIKNVNRLLKDGGELVFEFGGKGCAETVHGALEREFERHGLKYPRVFYFPTISEYAAILERSGFSVRYAALFDRPTVQKGNAADWIRMFVKKPFEGMDAALADRIINDAQDAVRDRLYADGRWIIDYVRIRMRAVKIGDAE